jgi:NAD(P)-dependent dehydrogenase (short-subunit alcohol dehydrogenase family)
MSWNPEEIPDQSGRLAIVTGANSGIGLSTARILAEHGARVILACRSEPRAEAALVTIRERVPDALVEYRHLDLSNLASVQAFAEGITESETRLDLLINNAGVMMPPRRSETADGFELQMGVNHLGHQSLTAQLIGLLNKTPGSRVVSVASQAHRNGRIEFKDLQWNSRGYRRFASYGQSKLANLLFSFELDRRLKAAQQTTMAVAAHPGWTATELQRSSAGARFLNPILAMKPDQGAMPTLRAATDPEVKGGEYFGPCGLYELRGKPVAVGSSRRARNEESARRLWTLSEELTGARFEGLDGHR